MKEPALTAAAHTSQLSRQWIHQIKKRDIAAAATHVWSWIKEKGKNWTKSRERERDDDGCDGKALELIKKREENEVGVKAMDLLPDPLTSSSSHSFSRSQQKEEGRVLKRWWGMGLRISLFSCFLLIVLLHSARSDGTLTQPVVSSSFFHIFMNYEFWWGWLWMTVKSRCSMTGEWIRFINSRFEGYEEWDESVHGNDHEMDCGLPYECLIC